MNRSHDGKQALEAIEVLNKSKINNLNVDLIYGYPTLDDKSWLENLKILTGFNVQHISCYCMTVEKNCFRISYQEKTKTTRTRHRSQTI